MKQGEIYEDIKFVSKALCITSVHVRLSGSVTLVIQFKSHVFMIKHLINQSF